MASGLVQCLGVLILLEAIYCLQVIPQWSNVTYLDPKYLDFAKIYIKRHGRKSGYYLNMEGRIKHTWANNITINLLFYEFLHNEYRRTFVEMHYKFCDLINKEAYVGTMLAKRGVTCPAPPRDYHLLNMTVQTDSFPNVFPFEKGRVDIEAALTDSGVSIVRGYIIATFKDKKVNSSIRTNF